MIKLRDYQEIIINESRQALKNKQTPAIVTAPTGAGKTVMFSYIAQRATERGMKVLILVHRTKLVEQTYKKLQRFGLDFQTLTAGYKRINDKPVYVAMVQTLARRTDLPKVDLVIADECHISNFDKLIQRYEGTPILGFTATPWRSQNNLHKIYKGIVQGIDTPDLIEAGYLLNARYFGAQDTAKIQKKGREFDDGANIEYTKQKGDPVELYKRFGDNRRAMVFCVNVADTDSTAERFIDAGYNAIEVHSKMDAKIVERRVQLYCEGKYDIIVNCGILTAGFDDETVGCIIVKRATTSLSLWLQICGRGSRPILDSKGIPLEGQESFIIIDLGSNIQRHGFWHQAREWSLKPKKKKEGVAPVKECPECFRICYASAKVCECGYEFPIKEKKEVEVQYEEILPISQESYERLKPILEMAKRKDYKQGWIVRRVLAKGGEELLKEWCELKGYNKRHLERLKAIYKL